MRQSYKPATWYIVLGADDAGVHAVPIKVWERVK